MKKFTSNSFCARLETCLRQLELFHFAVPHHEVITVVLEVKDFDSANFDDQHSIAELDALLNRVLGSHLFRPRDLFARCVPGTTSLRACLKAAGWPTLVDLRGKFIFVVTGSWRDKAPATFNYYGQAAIGWARYATDGGGCASAPPSRCPRTSPMSARAPAATRRRPSIPGSRCRSAS